MLQRVRIKICGVQDPKQAAKIAQMGADAVGLVFAHSQRWVSPEQARAVVDALPPLVSAVGVFVDADADTVNRVIARAGLHLVQLHGQEQPELLESLHRPAIKAFRVRGPDWPREVRAWLDRVRSRRQLAAVLLDAYDPDRAGGTGQRFAWEWVSDARRAGLLAGMPPLILSGGLDASNISGAIDVVQPWAVDVSSGVESSPGVKDIAKLDRFIRATREGGELRGEFWL